MAPRVTPSPANSNGSCAAGRCASGSLEIIELASKLTAALNGLLGTGVQFSSVHFARSSVIIIMRAPFPVGEFIYTCQNEIDLRERAEASQ